MSLLDSSPPQFVVNDTNSSTFYQPIYANTTDPQSRVIGELYQDNIFDASGNNRVGTHQGFAFNFGNSSALYNSNDILFFGDAGELNTIDTYILSGSGDFEKFSGGHMPEWRTLSDNPYIAEISLFESNVTYEDQTVLDVLTFRITNEGGSTPIVGEEGRIGETFQNRPVFQNGDQIGVNQGYGFLFPDDPHISTRAMGNRQFLFDDGNQMTVLNTLVVEASGPYAKFMGTYLNQTIISEHPNFMADITLTAAVDADDEEEIELYTPNEGTYDFKITSDGGYKALIKNPEGVQIGERFQNPVYNNVGERIGTDQGYGFNFPTVEYTREVFQGNRIYYLNGGTLNLFNEIIAGATGKYRAYKGGRFSAKIVSYNPVFEAEMTLLLPASKNYESDQAKEESAEGSKDAGSSTDEDEIIEGEGEEKDKASSGGIFVLSPIIGLFLVFQCLE